MTGVVRKCYTNPTTAEPRRGRGDERPPPLSPTAATVRRLYLEGALFVQTDHFRAELANAGADMADVEHVLEHGAVARLGAWEPEHLTYNYTVSGMDPEGSPLHVVCIDEANFRLILVTAF